MPIKEKLDEIIARRSLKIPGSNKRVTVYLGKPQQITESGQTYCLRTEKEGAHFAEIPKGHWICPYKITGLPLDDFPKSFYAELWGKDSMEALWYAMSNISAILDRCNPPLQWSHSWGFDPGMPVMLDLDGLEHKERIIEKFINVISEEMKLQSQRPRPAWVLKGIEQIKKGTIRSAASKRHKSEAE